MILRALILLGWKQSDQPGPNPVECIYCGTDGLALTKAHNQAQKSGDYVTFRKIQNPSGIPMPLTVDPVTLPPVFPKVEIPNHEPSLDKKLKVNADKIAADKKAADAIRAEQDRIDDESQAKADAEVAQQKRLKVLNSKSKAQLMADIEVLNEIAEDSNKIILPADAKKEDIVAALMAIKTE